MLLVGCFRNGRSVKGVGLVVGDYSSAKGWLSLGFGLGFRVYR